MRTPDLDVNFNMAWLWFITLNDMYREMYSIIMKQRDARMYYQHLSVIYSHVFMKIPKEKREDLQHQFDRLYLLVILPDKISDKTREYCEREGYQLCEILDRELKDILHAQKLFFPDMRFSMGMSEVKKRFKTGYEDTQLDKFEELE